MALKIINLKQCRLTLKYTGCLHSPEKLLRLAEQDLLLDLFLEPEQTMQVLHLNPISVIYR
jgi:hypothetical protein